MGGAVRDAWHSVLQADRGGRRAVALLFAVVFRSLGCVVFYYPVVPFAHGPQRTPPCYTAIVTHHSIVKLCKSAPHISIRTEYRLHATNYPVAPQALGHVP